MADLCPSLLFGARCTKAGGHSGRCRNQHGTWLASFRGPGLQPASAPTRPPAASQPELEFVADTATEAGEHNG